jgi:kinetochore protein NDC80
VYGKQSLGGGGSGSSAPIGKDPRPVREKPFQLNCIKNLINFLARAGYDKPISQKILTAPSTKDFQSIFKFLYAQIDPSYDFGKKFEDEVPGLLKGIRYPYSGDISKSSLLAVGSIHAWPALLAMLNWMVELIMCCDELASGAGPDTSNKMQDIDTAPVDATMEAQPEKIFFDYLCKSYKIFLAGNDDFDSMVQELGKNFGNWKFWGRAWIRGLFCCFRTKKRNCLR